MQCRYALHMNLLIERMVYMKKYPIVFALVISTLFCACSQSQNASEAEKPVYNTDVSKQASQENDEVTPEDSKTNKLILSDVFCEFSGVGDCVIKPQKTLLTNQKSNIICSDGSGTVYYVNYGTYEDNYIYSYKDGSSTLLVDKIANFINYYDEKLYFLVDDKAPEALPWSWGGELYCYDLKTKETSRILEMSVYNLLVKDGVFYFCSELLPEGEGNRWYSMSIDDSTPKEMGRMLPFFYGDYQLAYSDDDEYCALTLVGNSEEIVLTNKGYFRNGTFSVQGDSLWVNVYEGNIPAVARINLSDGTQKLYKAEKTTASGFDMNLTTGMSFETINNTLYVVSNSTVFVYSEGGERFEPLLNNHFNFSHIYSDAELLYAVRFDGAPYSYHNNDILMINPQTKTWEVITQ